MSVIEAKVAVRPEGPTASRQDSPEELRKACRQFEEIFLRLMLKEAHLERSLQGESDRAGLYGDVVIESLAKSVASGGGMGIAEMLYRQLDPKTGHEVDSTATNHTMRQPKDDRSSDASP